MSTLVALCADGVTVHADPFATCTDAYWVELSEIAVTSPPLSLDDIGALWGAALIVLVLAWGFRTLRKVAWR